MLKQKQLLMMLWSLGKWGCNDYMPISVLKKAAEALARQCKHKLLMQV